MRVNNKDFSIEELQDAARRSLDKVDFALNIGFSFTNGKVYKKLEKIIAEYNLDVSHFDSKAKTKNNRKYPIIKKNCPVCGDEFETQIGSKEERVTCSYSCSNVYFSDVRHTDESNLKRANKLTKLDAFKSKNILFSLVCEICKNSFQSHDRRVKFCSSRCSGRANWLKPEFRQNLINQLHERIANGHHKGWSSRSKLDPSYPEKYIISLLEELDIKYLQREFKVNKWFIDFADIDRKLALEIDGGQHELPERKASDAQKDQYLTSQGWVVKRIKWKKPNKEIREEYIKEILEFLK